MLVFVTGGTGHVGSYVIPHLIEAGHEVVALARSDASAATASALGAKVRRGDLADLDGLAAAATEFLSANLHVALDRTQVVNYAQWESREALGTARENPRLATLMQEQTKIAQGFSPVLYALCACIPSAR